LRSAHPPKFTFRAVLVSIGLQGSISSNLKLNQIRSANLKSHMEWNVKCNTYLLWIAELECNQKKGSVTSLPPHLHSDPECPFGLLGVQISAPQQLPIKCNKDQFTISISFPRDCDAVAAAWRRRRRRRLLSDPLWWWSGCGKGP
jgi:hypothetical protein